MSTTKTSFETFHLQAVVSQKQAIFHSLSQFDLQSI